MFIRRPYGLQYTARHKRGVCEHWHQIISLWLKVEVKSRCRVGNSLFGFLCDSYRDWAAACVPVKPGGAAGPVLPVPAVSSRDHPVAVGWGDVSSCRPQATEFRGGAAIRCMSAYHETCIT